MKLTFISNYINHHQLPFCEACYRELEKDFTFIQVMPMAGDRQALGWKQDAAERPYVRLLYKDAEICRRILAESDVVLLGWMGDEYDDLAGEILQPSLEKKRPVFRSSERIYKTGQWKMISPRGLIAKRRQHLIYRDAPVYLLCSGAYVASDYALIGAYPGKKYKWGYFPPFKAYEEGDIISGNRDISSENSREIRLVWAGRFVSWKHPEFTLRLADTLRQKGIRFRLTMTGDGRLRAETEERAKAMGFITEGDAAARIEFTGALSPEGVRFVMEEGDVFLFTSNYLEGWGAVVNEAMNSAMTVIASDEAGAVPWLIKNGVNGITYHGGSYEAFEQAVMKVLDFGDNRHVMEDMRLAAYRTIRDVWNAEEAAGRFLNACREALGGAVPTPAADGGPMSTADVIRPPGFIRSLQENSLAEGL